MLTLSLACPPLQDWIKDHKSRNIQTVLANPSRQVLRQLEVAGIPELLGREFVCVRMHDAVTMCQVGPLPWWTTSLPAPADSKLLALSSLHEAADVGCGIATT